MTETKSDLNGPDLAKGISLAQVADGGMLLGHAHGEPVLLARRGGSIYVGERLAHEKPRALKLIETPQSVTIVGGGAAGNGKKLAVAVVHRDLEGLHAEVEFERAIAARA